MRTFPLALLLIGCSLDPNDNEFTCRANDMCGEYVAIDADRANELKADCLTGAENGLTCDSSLYSYVCYFAEPDAETCTYSDTLTDEWCSQNQGQTSCPL